MMAGFKATLVVTILGRRRAFETSNILLLELVEGREDTSLVLFISNQNKNDLFSL